RDVGAAGTAELRIQLDAAAHVHHHQERWAPLAGGQRTGVGLGLAARAQQGVVEALVAGALAQLLGLEHEGAAAVQVDTAGAGAAVAVHEGDRTLEHVVLLGRWMRARHPPTARTVRSGSSATWTARWRARPATWR